MRQAVFCIARDESQTNRIIDRLRNSGFANENISVLFSENNRLKSEKITEDPTKDSSFVKNHSSIGHEKHTKAPEGATTGTITGGIIGGAIGLLIGIGAIVIPGLGAFIAAGPLIAALSGAAVGGGIGLITGALIGLGIPEMEAKLYESSLKAGHILVCVHCDTHDQIHHVKEIFKECDASQICTAEEVKSSR